METNILTLRQLISYIKCREGWEEKVYQHLFKRDKETYTMGKTIDITKTREGYGHVMTELLAKKEAKPYKYPICVRDNVDPFDKTSHVEVCLMNPNYEKPAKGLKWWGGKSGSSKAPAGRYNINLEKHNQWFAFGYTDWSKIIDTKIFVKTKQKIEFHEVLARILWELTFDGWTEIDVKKNTKKLMKTLEKATKQVAAGKCKTIKSKTGGVDIVIPDIVSKQINDIIKKIKDPKK